MEDVPVGVPSPYATNIREPSMPSPLPTAIQPNLLGAAILNHRSPLRLAVNVKMKLTLSPLYMNVDVGESSMIARWRSDSCLGNIWLEERLADAARCYYRLLGMLIAYPALPGGPTSSS